MTLVIFPSGYFADKYRRDWLLKSAAVIGVIAIGVAFYASSLFQILIALIFWGLFQGLTRPSLEAIFADSVITGNRSRIYSLKHSVQQVSMASGPFVNVGLFYYFGDEWKLSILKSVLYVGLLISFFSLISLVLFNDDMSMDDASESLPESQVVGNGFTRTTRSTKLIPYFLIGSNLIIGFGAGMTIRFFPIFFLEIYDLKPISVNLIMGLTAIFTGVASILAQRKSLSQGRAETIFIVQITATACLFALAFYPPVLFLVPLFIARGSLMNAAQPLSRSILMDTIPKQHKGKVNALEGIAWGLFWNVSAVVGGYLIDWYDYHVTFLITASVYTVGTTLILFLIPLVSMEKTSTKFKHQSAITPDQNVLTKAK
jgi:MFS family permease